MDIPYIDQSFDADRWYDEGFRSREDSIEWSDNACGIACLLMALRYFLGGGTVRKQELLHEAISAGAYSPRGWIHYKLAGLAISHGLSSSTADVGADLDLVCNYLDKNMLVIASVTWRFPCDGRKGGHLVLVNGYTRTRGGLSRLLLRDPSSWGRDHEWIEPERFLCSFTGRVISIGANDGRDQSLTMH